MINNSIRKQQDHEIDEQLYIEKVKLLYSHEPVGFAATLINSSILIAILWTKIPSMHLIGWGAALFVLTFARAWFAHQYNRLEKSYDVSVKFGRIFISGITVSAVLWGSASHLIYPAAIRLSEYSKEELNTISFFCIFLPVAEGRQEFVDVPVTEKKDAGTSPYTVLLIDDEPSVLDTGKLMLKRLGCEIFSAIDSEKAIELYQDHYSITSELLQFCAKYKS